MLDELVKALRRRAAAVQTVSEVDNGLRPLLSSLIDDPATEGETRRALIHWRHALDNGNAHEADLHARQFAALPITDEEAITDGR